MIRDRTRMNLLLPFESFSLWSRSLLHKELREPVIIYKCKLKGLTKISSQNSTPKMLENAF
jgi:hypothetical protein